MSTDQLLSEKNGAILTLVLNRPEKRNALTPDMLILLHEALNQAAEDEAIRAVILRGQGDKAFSSGYDVTAIPTRVSPELQALLDKKSPFELALDSIINFPYPVIAMLNGFAGRWRSRPPWRAGWPALRRHSSCGRHTPPCWAGR